MNHVYIAMASGGLSDGQRIHLALAIAEKTGGDYEPLLMWDDRRLVERAKELSLC